MPRNQTRVAAIIVNWNRGDLTMRAANSLLSQLGAADRVMLVDNGSSGDDAEWLSAHYAEDPRVEVVRLAENTGFTGGVNAGYAVARAALPEHVLLLNNDAIAEPNCIAALVLAARTTGAGVVGALVRSASDKVIFSGRSFPGELFGRPRVTPVEPGGWTHVGRADGCAMLVAGDVADTRFRANGWLLDPRYFLYWEDVDLCMYAKSIGRPTIVCFDAAVIHEVAASSGGAFNPRGTYYQTRNRVIIAREWLSPVTLLAFHLYFVLSRIAVQLVRIPRGNAHLRISAMALCDAYRGRSGRRDGLA